MAEETEDSNNGDTRRRPEASFDQRFRFRGIIDDCVNRLVVKLEHSDRNYDRA